MTINELQKDWKNYTWERQCGKEIRCIILKDFYFKCEKKVIGKKKVPALVFHLKFDHGSWCYEVDILKCDEEGNCYHFTFLAKNINKYIWQKSGKFIKLPAIK